MYLQIHVACGSLTEAEKISSALVDERLAACAQISGPVTSVYRWEGKVETTEEWMCTMKTREALYDDIEAEVLSIHSYDTPEIIATSVTHGNARYLKWVDEMTRSDGQEL